MNVKSFASRVRGLRKERDLSQENLAQKLGVSRQTVFLVESGQSLPSLPLALKMASLFDQTIDKLINSEIDRFFEDAFEPHSMALPQIGMLALNVHQDEKNVYIEVAIPGFSADEIETELSDDYLTIRGEKSKEHEQKGKTYLRREFAFGRFERTIALPDGINTEKADSTLKDGTLTVTLPKSPQTKPKVKKLKPRAS